MAKIHHVDFSPSDWIAGTLGMTPEEEGIYIRIIARIYAAGGPLPADRTVLAHLCGVRPQVMRRVLNSLISAGKFDETGGKLTSNRCETELKLARNRIEQARFNGSKGGRNKGLEKAAGLGSSKANTNTNTIYSEAKASAASGPSNGSDDLAAEVFKIGVQIMVRRGVPEGQARSILGKHRSELKDDGRLLAILASVERNNPIEPIGYLAKIIAGIAAPPEFGAGIV